MAFYLYRKAARYVIPALVAALLATPALGQSKKKEKGPRALALVELPKDPKLAPRLIPITILDNNRFFDASVYLASPVPMAIDSGVVYEAERNGQSVGFFTVEGSRQVNGEWVALGHWQTRESIGEAAKKKASASPQTRSPEDEDKPPVLRRPPSQAPSPAAEPSASAGQPPPSVGSVPPAPAPAQTAQHRSPIPPASEQVDADRPTLRRGKPPSVQHEEVEFQPPTMKTATAGPGAAPAEKAASSPVPFREVLVAVSDAHGLPPQTYEFHWTPEERQEWTRKLSETAAQEVAKYAKAKPGLKYPPAASFDQSELKAFDLVSDNNPTLVFTARAPRAGAVTRANQTFTPADYFYYVTIVARQEPAGELRKLFSWVTDTAHLDAFSRLELVDAVDAEGDGRGELLFRAISDTGRSYRLYRVTRDGFYKLFEGGSAAQ